MVTKTIRVRFGKCTTLLVPKSWPMKAWLRDVDQWKAENLAGFCNWPITRCFIQNDRARQTDYRAHNRFCLIRQHWRAVQVSPKTIELDRPIIEHTTDFALSGNTDGPCNYRPIASRDETYYPIIFGSTNNGQIVDKEKVNLSLQNAIKYPGNATSFLLCQLSGHSTELMTHWLRSCWTWRYLKIFEVRESTFCPNLARVLLVHFHYHANEPLYSWWLQSKHAKFGQKITRVWLHF